MAMEKYTYLACFSSKVPAWRECAPRSLPSRDAATCCCATEGLCVPRVLAACLSQPLPSRRAVCRTDPAYD
eukprot:COSAG01_NODE_56448_length_318_cov_0.940639_1_plen_70_part_10